jgi:ADP-heptose:LPS heptosyltransferase
LLVFCLGNTPEIREVEKIIPAAMIAPKRIILSRTDSIGDVILTLPLAGALKKKLPGCRVIFLGRDYTRDVVAWSSHVDEFISWDDITKKEIKNQVESLNNLYADTFVHVFPGKEIARLAAKAGIPNRVGTTGRVYHYLYCNRLVAFSRRKSDLHEAQLNFKLMKPIIGDDIPGLEEISNLYGFQIPHKPDRAITSLLDANKFNLILHPKSKGSAREWPLEKYSALINALPQHAFKIFVSGTPEESKLMKDFLAAHHDRILDLTGTLTLSQFMQFISLADGLVAASTGPLHIAAALGKLAVGIYPPIKPMDPGRWAPIGKNAHYFVADKECDDCRQSGQCACMAIVKPADVAELIKEYAGSREEK